eukprot:TRINITY_DN2328_c0_g1_i1.p1 TRINITY_DN2328_c0_g1~~TRINITY_DN2328_c0_g1_i1.p1  ORF type:complete len:1080 (+),score=470.57 TRINITY_DN2328_c0_g1_i1:226-3465(+)
MRLDLFMRALMPSQLRCTSKASKENPVVANPSSYRLEQDKSESTYFKVPSDLTFEIEEEEYEESSSLSDLDRGRTVRTNYSTSFIDHSPSPLLNVSNKEESEVVENLYHSTDSLPSPPPAKDSSPSSPQPSSSYQYSDEASSSGTSSYLDPSASESYALSLSPSGKKENSSLASSSSSASSSSAYLYDDSTGKTVPWTEIKENTPKEEVKNKLTSSTSSSTSSSPSFASKTLSAFIRRTSSTDMESKKKREEEKKRREEEKKKKKEESKKRKSSSGDKYFGSRTISVKPSYVTHKSKNSNVTELPLADAKTEASPSPTSPSSPSSDISYEAYEPDESPRSPPLVSTFPSKRSEYILREDYGENFLKAGAPALQGDLYAFTDTAKMSPEVLKKAKDSIEPEGTLRDEMIAKFVKVSKERGNKVSRSRDWNQEFQNVMYGLSQLFGSEAKLTTPEDIVKSFDWGRAHSLVQEFSDNAMTYAKIIISEVFLPSESKTFKPVDIGGVAGGSKYIVQNILFKFATDTLISHRPEMWMYGGKVPDHTAAAKTAKNEMNGREALGATYVDGLHYPMMTVIDYMGFRVVAMAVIPISSSTIKYGSNDAGATIHADDEALNKRMELAGKRLNLKPHMTGMKTKKMIAGPGDIEGHITKAGDYYVVDFGRVFPPEDPSFRYGKASGSRAVFYSLLRPQLVAANEVPLCSDSFTKWNSDDDVNVRLAHNAEVTEATGRLYNEYIPNFAKHLDSIPLDWDVLWSPNAKSEDLVAALEAVGPNEAHKRYTNVRHIGRVRLASSSSDIKRLLLSVAAARVAKDDLKELMRVKMAEISAASTQPFKEVVVRFLNQLQGVCVTSSRYWNTVMPQRLEEKFGEILEEEEKGKDLREFLDMRIVFILALRLTGTKLNDMVAQELLTSADFRFVEADIDEINSVVRHQSQQYLWGSLALMQKVIHMKMLGRKGTEIARLIVAAESRAHEAHLCAPVCPVIDITWAMTRLELMEARGGKSINDKELNSIEGLLDYSSEKLGERPFIKTMRAHVMRYQSVLIETNDPKEAMRLNEHADILTKEAEEAPAETLCTASKIQE